MTYRINWGNGNALGAWATLSEAKRQYALAKAHAKSKGDPWFAYIQHRVDDEWRRVRLECEES